ncbi:MAG TPA: NUDIX domain-containing protein [Caulobacteraceae bacterium]|nr:NUDIX domain-containing protein [Caulobacteraceae bacterium]
MDAETLHREIVRDGYITVERLRLRLADGAEVTREIERHGDAVAVLPYDAARRRALTVRLFRTPVFAATGAQGLEEACAGMIEDEAADAAVRREALEELGVALDALEAVGMVWSSPGVSTERVSLFLAPYRAADRVGAGGGVAGEHEGITVLEAPLADLAARGDAGAIADAKLLALVMTLRVRRPDLFSGAD